MHGGSYTAEYAASGEEQIDHYMMKNRSTSLGYLIVFDGRIEDFADGLN
jgi:hypothetical protein